MATHFLFVGFVVLGFAAIWLGAWLRWPFVRNFYFRVAHLVAMAIVALQAVAGLWCPLTVWESRLRELAGQAVYGESFIAHWLGRIIFYDVSPEAFMIVYVAFFALVAVTFWRVRPRRPPWLFPRRPRAQH